MKNSKITKKSTVKKNVKKFVPNTGKKCDTQRPQRD